MPMLQKEQEQPASYKRSHDLVIFFKSIGGFRKSQGPEILHFSWVGFAGRLSPCGLLVFFLFVWFVFFIPLPLTFVLHSLWKQGLASVLPLSDICSQSCWCSLRISVGVETELLSVMSLTGESHPPAGCQEAPCNLRNVYQGRGYEALALAIHNLLNPIPHDRNC